MASPNFDFENVYNELIEEGGQSQVIYINGVWTTPSGFKDQQKTIVETLNFSFSGNLHEKTFNASQPEVFIPESDELIQIPGLNNLKGSVWFDPRYNSSDSTGNGWNDAIIAFEKGIGTALVSFTLGAILGKGPGEFDKIDWKNPIEIAGAFLKDIFKEVISNGISNIFNGFIDLINGNNPDIKIDQSLTGKYNTAAELLQLIIKDPAHAFTSGEFVPKLIDLIEGVVSAVPLPPPYKTWVAAFDAIYKGALAAVPEDFKEAFEQFWYLNPTQASETLNSKWIPDATNWLNNTNNSLILMGYSQGNFFLEDGLKTMGDNAKTSQTRILAFGSPTNYLAAGGIEKYNGDDKYNIRNDGDPITKLQFSDDSWLNKIKSIFNAGITAFQQGGFSQHDFDKYVDDGSKVDNGFKELIYELHPKGYYFPSKDTSMRSGTEDDDWIEGTSGADTIEGKERNDVLRGNSGDDILIGGSGYDILDGGEGKDTADYSSSESGIKVWSDKVAGQDVYKVEDGFVVKGEKTVDTVGNIEIISGSKFDDQMTGGDYDDTFYGQGGIDTFWGQKGKDTFYGGTGDDKAYGGDDDDDLRGDEGNDDLRGEKGNDSLYGGADKDSLYGGEGDDELRGEQGEDDLRGEDGKDTLYGGSENDFLYGGKDEDQLYGEDGDDELRGEENNDSLYGGTGKDTLYGGSGDDDLRGEKGDDILRGEDGIDTLYGGDDQDELYGGLNDDLLYGEAGNDKLYGEAGNDKLYGQAGNDSLYGGDNNDLLEGGDNDDYLEGGSGFDQLYGQAGSDLLFGNSGDDFLDGGTEADELHGGIGRDKLFGQAGNDLLFGEADNDTLDGGTGADTLSGGSGDDKLYGREGEDILSGNQGNDYLEGGDNSDQLFGNGDDDTLKGQAGDDFLNGNSGNDDLFGEAGDDLLIGEAGNDFIDGGSEVDTVSYFNSPSGVIVNIDESKGYESDRTQRESLFVTNVNPIEYYLNLEPDFQINAGTAKDGFGTTDSLRNLENIIGSEFDDILIGNSKDNRIEALAGDDLLIGNAGNDIFDGGDGIDILSYRRDPNGVRVNLETGRAIDGWGGNDVIIPIEGSDTISTIENVIGSRFNDELIGDSNANIITADDGNDIVKGGGGNDQLYGEKGNDEIWGGTGNDSIYGNEGQDSINGEDGQDYIRGGDGHDQIFAGAGDDTVAGDSGKGNDIIYGEEGNDSLAGGAGNDFISGGTGKDSIYGERGVVKSSWCVRSRSSTRSIFFLSQIIMIINLYREESEPCSLSSLLIE